MKINYTIGLVLLMGISIGSCIHEPMIYPEDPGDTTEPGCVDDGLICFESSVLPIFLSSCARVGCHDSQSHEEGYVLNTYTNILKKGIRPGDANDSKIYEVLFENGDDRMPPDAPLSQAQKDSIKVWINQGAKNTTDCNCFCDTTAYTFDAIINPILLNNCVGCHKPGSLEANIDLSTYDKVKIQADNGKLLGSASHAVGYSPMPQGGKLTDCEITQIRKWVEAGALDN
jgi:Planctomycete cytochrome C